MWSKSKVKNLPKVATQWLASDLNPLPCIASPESYCYSTVPLRHLFFYNLFCQLLFITRSTVSCIFQTITLLTMGLYPNVCYHKEKRKVLTTESKAALVHKSSVNCSNQAVHFQSPFFVFGEKVAGLTLCAHITN